MTDSPYQTLIDAPTWAFIRSTAAAYPDDAVTLDVAGQRAVYDRMCAVFRQPRPAGVAVADESRGGVPVRRYETGGAAAGTAAVTVVYLHGGGFVVGGLDSHDDVCAEICAATGLRVVSVDYRLVPEHPHPAAFLDTLAATRAVAAAFGPVILAGDSAGGALAASAAQALRATAVDLRGVVLIYPGLGGDRTAGSYVTHAQAPMLTTADVEYYHRLRHGGTPPVRDPTASALDDGDFGGLPPVAAFSAECDPLADDGRAYRDRVRAAGGAAEWHLDRGLVHGWLRARHSVPRARAAFDRILATIAAMARGATLPEGMP
jgi:acetyl esterase